MKREMKTASKQNRLARVWAKTLSEEYHHWHRGAFHCGHGCRVIFGNDGYSQDKRAGEEVRLVKEHLKPLDIVVEGFGVSPGGYTWAMIVKCNRTKMFERMVWDAWFEACGWSKSSRKELLRAA